jgi:hypothetical protein
MKKAPADTVPSVVDAEVEQRVPLPLQALALEP